MRRKRRHHLPGHKAKVALVAIKNVTLKTSYSHSIINSPTKSITSAGFPVVVSANTMRNTMLNIYC